MKLFETHFPDKRLWLSFTCRDAEHLSDGRKFSEAAAELQQSYNHFIASHVYDRQSM